MGTLADDARNLMTATADVAGEKVSDARKRLAAALERGKEIYGRVKRRRSKGPRRPTRPCVSILIKPSASPSGWAWSSAISSRAGAPGMAIDAMMEIGHRQLSGHIAASSKRFARRLLTIGENRLELLTVEVQEERERLLHALLLALGVAVFGLLAGVALTGAIVVLLWHVSPVAVLLVLTGLYAGIAGCLYRRFTALQLRLENVSRHPRSTQKGPRMFGNNPRVNPLEARKRLLVAESELNRAQLVEEWAS